MIDQLRINSSSCLSRLRESIVRIISYLDEENVYT